jgi:hypothetical protein
LTQAKATSVQRIKPPSAADKILASFTKREKEALSEYYRKRFQLQGKSTSSKTVGVISDMHVGSDTGLYSGYGPVKISKDQQKLCDWWQHCADASGRVTVLLLNGEPVQGPNKRGLGSENWSSDSNETLDDAERLIRIWKEWVILIMKRWQNFRSA